MNLDYIARPFLKNHNQISKPKGGKMKPLPRSDMEVDNRKWPPNETVAFQRWIAIVVPQWHRTGSQRQSIKWEWFIEVKFLTEIWKRLRRAERRKEWNWIRMTLVESWVLNLTPYKTSEHRWYTELFIHRRETSAAISLSVIHWLQGSP